MTRGRIILVGAGPGDPGLITVKGLDRLRQADVVLYDRLVDPALLEEAPRLAEKIFAGKESRRHVLEQDLINELMLMHARQGKTVVRLKGGDPFVFGRGGEEAAFLRERNIDLEVVPGISSCIAVPALAGIPLTYRGISAGFAVTTGHSCGPETEPGYASMLRSSGTLVILMGVSNLRHILTRMIGEGTDPEMPVAIIEEGTNSGQRTHTGTVGAFLASLPEVRSPAVIVVGQVVRLRHSICWLAEGDACVDKTEAEPV